VVSWLTGLGLAFYAGSDAGSDFAPSIPALAWVAIPFIVESVIAACEQANDKKLREELFNPKYNPSPAGYERFAQALAQYETELMQVFATRNGSRYHTNEYCSGMTSPVGLPKYDAEARGFTPCSRCGYYIVRPRPLPTPFGNGSVAPLRE
jgi:hypothetical protein